MGRFSNLEFERDDEFRKELGAKPDRARDAAKCLAEAEQLYREGRFEKALRSYSRVLEYDAGCTDAWVGQVRMLLELGDAREAKVWVDKALEIFKDHPELLAAKAVAFARIGWLDDALKLSDVALRQKGETPYVWIARGEVLLARKDANEDFCFARALAARAADWFTRVVIARVYAAYRKFAQAVKVLQEALGLNATSAFAWFQLANCHAALGLVTQARQGYQQALELDPDAPGARDRLRELEERGALQTLWDRVTGFFRQR